MAEPSTHKHHMLSEIFETPAAVRDTVANCLDTEGMIALPEVRLDAAKLLALKQVNILASGTSRHAGLAGKLMIQELAGLHVDVDYASEFSYASQEPAAHELTILITQSGETADTLNSLHVAAAQGSATLAICNVIGATLARSADSVLYTTAGPEISIASTKAFTAQMAALYLFSIFLGLRRGVLSAEDAAKHIAELQAIPSKVDRVLACEPACAQIAEKNFIASDFLFLGRGVHFPVALDGALKLKETSYIHAEGYPAGEVKHGPYALIDPMTPIVFLAACDPHDAGSMARYRMTLQNMRDVRERQGRLIAITVEGDTEVASIAQDVLYVPSAPELLLPLLEIVPLQLLAYHVALRRGVDVDNPRNLVKSVTVE